MGNKYPQTNEAKEKFTSPLLTYIQVTAMENPAHVFTREELAETLQQSDRFIRKEMERIANYYPIISVSDRKGYVYATFSEKASLQTLDLLLDDVKHAINELRSRVESLNARMKPLIALQEVLEDKILDKALEGEGLETVEI